MALGITSIFGEKRPILCVTEKKTKKAIPILVGGSPNWFLSKFPIWGSPNRFGVHSNLGTNTSAWDVLHLYSELLNIRHYQSHHVAAVAVEDEDGNDILPHKMPKLI